jgi:hypothetical protein
MLSKNTSNYWLIWIFFFDEKKAYFCSVLRCKCLINGVKIASAHSKVRTEAKRAAALKAIRYLHNLFPTIKVNRLFLIS